MKIPNFSKEPHKSLYDYSKFICYAVCTQLKFYFLSFWLLKFHHVRLTDNPRSVHFLSIVIFIHYYRRFYSLIIISYYILKYSNYTIQYITLFTYRHKEYLWRHRTKVLIICKVLHSYTSTFACLLGRWPIASGRFTTLSADKWWRLPASCVT